jgi:aminoglycoside 3-N-acetyltransferase
VGAIVECFRHAPGVRRSSYPSVSFAAWGRQSHRIVADHSLDDDLGEGSPLARIYDLDGQVLLLGVGHDNNTSLHLAEYRAGFPGWRWEGQGSPVLAETGHERRSPVGATQARLMRQRAVVDYAVAWMVQHRTA